MTPDAQSFEDRRREYLKEAEFAREQAKLAVTEEMRANFSKLARDWDRLASLYEDEATTTHKHRAQG